MDTAFFIVAKVAGALLKVETWLLVLALIAFLAARRKNLRLAQRASGLLVTILLIIGFLPLGDVLFWSLEARVPVSRELASVDGVVVLGGGEDVQASLASGQPQLGEGGDRYVAALTLARRHPEAKLVFAGGSGRLRDVTGAEVSEASIAERIFQAQGIAPDRLSLEGRSRNTAENAKFAFEQVQPQAEETWVLVTSAFHMPRAMKSFLAAGWQGIIAHPVDYRTRSFVAGLGWNFDRNLEMLNTGIREWVGRAAYALSGR